jgi:hypothetical protein
VVKSPELERLERLAEPVLRRFGVNRAGFFGSRARGAERPGSDLDVVVELSDERTLYDQIRLQLALSEALGVEAHVSTYDSLHPAMRERILAEEVRVLG